MSDAWNEIQAIKSKRNSLREKLNQRKKERDGILGTGSVSADVPPAQAATLSAKLTSLDVPVISADKSRGSISPQLSPGSAVLVELEQQRDREIEEQLLSCLCEVVLTLPADSKELIASLAKTLTGDIPDQLIHNLLQKLAAQDLISVREIQRGDDVLLEVTSVEHSRLQAVVSHRNDIIKPADPDQNNKKRKREGEEEVVTTGTEKKATKDVDILSLLSRPSIREKESKKMGEEILDLLSKPTTKERSLAERFRSQGGAQVQEFCPHGTKDECKKLSSTAEHCKKLHFRKILQKHTDESLGDCSFLNTCFHMDTCKYIHYEVDYSGSETIKAETPEISASRTHDKTILFPPQWIQCDLRYFDMSILGEFAVVMADPPWDIHMELPYGTMSDDEMRALNIPTLQKEGLIFLWVTGRAMELGRECLQLWGYERIDEIIWVKTNQLQRIIRTGRTGHWLNHGKEHCLVGMKGNPSYLNRGLDADVIVAEVRATSHKPDEIYGIIERLAPGTKKIELFGRPHNVQPNWITIGNQLDGVKLLDPELVVSFKAKYPEGNCMKIPTS